MKFSEVVPQCDYLRVMMKTTVIFGYWPSIFKTSFEYKKLYNIYCQVVYYMMIYIALSATLEFFVLVNMDERKMEDISSNLFITFIMIVETYRGLRLKMPIAKDMLQNIIKKEKKIFDSGDKDIIKICQDSILRSNLVNKIYFIIVPSATVFIHLRPYFTATQEFDSVLNKTVVVRIHAISTWFPFDQTKHYWMVAFLQTFFEYVFTSTMMSVDIFTFSLIMFPLGEIKILKHIIKNFDKYVLKIKTDHGYDDATASFLTLRECILLHKEIIKYVDDYNLIMSNVTLLDYLQSSLELATIILQINSGNSFYSLLFVGACATCIISRAFIFYWYADQLTLEALDISRALFESNWYEQTRVVKQMISIMIMKCNQDVALFIGPFDNMSLKTFLAVIKGTYSFVAMLHTLS